MARIRYIGDEDKTDAFGRDWIKGTWVTPRDLDDAALATLAQNPQFEVTGVAVVEPEPDEKDASPEDAPHADAADSPSA